MYLSLSSSGPIEWNHNQESSLIQDVSPFSPAYDGRSTTTLRERMRELYLQFLWLPESVMPLNQFVRMARSLARHSAPASSADDEAHPLHAALDGVTLTGKWCSYKYQERLPNALVVPPRAPCADTGADTDTDREASIMRFVLDRHAPRPERPEGPARDRDRDPSRSSSDESRRWLSEIEKREVKIQILLHLLKLTLPGPCSAAPVRPLPVPSHARKKRRRVQPSSDEEVDPTPRSVLEDRLEGLMDRLVLWQMALPDVEAGADGTKPVRDWMQMFCDDVVQPAFSQELPEQYKLLRQKLFRIPQWMSSSDAESDGDNDMNDSNDAKSTPQDEERPDHAALLFNSARARTNNADSKHGSAAQSRSRSLSISLEQEAGMRRTESNPRRVLHREVSMSKVFKGRRNGNDGTDQGAATTCEEGRR
ncbi:hypothetical protein F5148DRAFT_12471 [Russula earlei]|uniref:Uncharacterized protein n=1 Tax=Russula earlei TaxID=71964 RepID=A0ACC0UPK7_9AGAM|nr:hypothetical protein F5148DRAFT_12471 [Russula earlei]